MEMPVKFYLSHTANLNGERRIRVSVSILGERYLTTAGFHIGPDHWIPNAPEDSPLHTLKNVWVIPGTQNSEGIDADVINARLGKIVAHFREYSLICRAKPTQEQFRREFLIAIGRMSLEPEPDSVSIYDRFREFMREESIHQEWEMETYKAVKTAYSHLLSFGQAHTLNYFNEDGINRYVQYLRGREMEDVSVLKQLKNLLWFINWAIRKGYTTERTIQTYRPKLKVVDKPVIFLTPEELMRLYHYRIPEAGVEVELSNSYGRRYKKKVESRFAMEVSRDIFCFCSFSSLRFGDVTKLRWTDIQNGVMTITTYKTHDRLPIELTPFSQALLDKYRCCEFPDYLVFPPISNQEMNRSLKDLCELCGINAPVHITCYRNGRREDKVYQKFQKIGTHAARKTFICFALSNGVPPDVVMQWTGHSDYESMKPYIAISDQTRSNAMKKLGEQWKKYHADEDSQDDGEDEVEV